MSKVGGRLRIRLCTIWWTLKLPKMTQLLRHPSHTKGQDVLIDQTHTSRRLCAAGSQSDRASDNPPSLFPSSTSWKQQLQAIFMFTNISSTNKNSLSCSDGYSHGTALLSSCLTFNSVMCHLSTALAILILPTTPKIFMPALEQNHEGCITAGGESRTTAPLPSRHPTKRQPKQQLLVCCVLSSPQI